MNPNLSYYNPFGLQASGTLTFVKQLAAGDEITVHTNTYTAGTTFAIGQSLYETAKNFAAAVNADRGLYAAKHAAVVPVRPYFAIYYGNVVAIVAVAPGSGGNLISLAGVSNKVTASASKLSGGTSASVAVVATAAAPAIADATTVVWTSVELTLTATAATVVSVATMCRQAILQAALANSHDAYIGPTADCHIPLVPGGAYNVPSIAGASFNLLTWFVKGTAGEKVILLYAI